MPSLSEAEGGRLPDLQPLATVAPAGTPSAMVDRLNREIFAIAASPELALVLEPDEKLSKAITRTVFAGRIEDELAQWKQIAADHKILAE